MSDLPSGLRLRGLSGSGNGSRRARLLSRLSAALGTSVLLAGLVLTGAAAAAPAPPGPSGSAPGPGSTHPGPPVAAACGTPGAHHARCGAVQLLDPSQNWHPGPAGRRSGGSGGGGSTVPSPPSSGYYPSDLQSAYGLANAAASFAPGSGAPTIAIVDAYDDPNAAADLAAYRASLSGATDPNTGLPDATIPPLCTSTVTSGCVTFTKVNQTGGTRYPKANAGWAEEISLDLDMASAICPRCNIVLVEASSSSFSNLATAVSYAKSLHPAVVTNSYGGGEFSSETSDNATYSGTTATAMTAATGDNGYGVEYPAASPGLTAVGGTSLTYARTSTGIVWNPQTVWSGAGSGCSAYEPMPSWQNDSGVYSLAADCTGRQTGDVAAVANPSTGVAVYDTYKESGWLVFGGTSVSTQIIGAIYGLAAGSGTIQAAPGALYTDASGGTGPTAGLVPVTSGSNTSCGDYLCDASDSLSSGYNGPTGLGTPYGVGAFVTSASTSPGFGLSATPTSATVTQGSTTSYTVSVSPSGGFSGDVGLTVSGCPSNATCSLSPTTVSSSSSPTPWTSTLSVATTSSIATGTDTLTITGASNGVPSQTTDVTLNVEAPQSTRTMTVTVSGGKLAKKGPNYQAPLTVAAADASSGAAISGASVALQVFAGSTCTGTVAASGTGTTGTNGQVGFTFSSRQQSTWCALATVSDTGYSPGSGETVFST